MRHTRPITRLAMLLLVMVMVGVVAAQDVTQASKSAIMRQLAEDVYTGARFDLLRTAFTPDFTWRMAGGESVALPAWRREVAAMATALPDLEARTLKVLTDGVWAASLIRFNGIFSEPLERNGDVLPPNNDVIEWLQIDIVRFDNGRAVSGYSERDNAALLAQFDAGQAGPQALAPVQARNAATAAQAGQAAQAASAALVYTREDERRFNDTLDALFAQALLNPTAEVLRPLFSDDFVLHLADRDGGFDDLLALLAALQMAMPDAFLVTPTLMVDDNFGAARWLINGMATGGWVEPGLDVVLPPNGQTLTLTANQFFRFNPDAQLAEAWLIYDRANWTAQFSASALATEEAAS